MKYMLILFLLMMENISSNVRIIVYLKTVPPGMTAGRLLCCNSKKIVLK